jgi:hypothetical protein
MDTDGVTGATQAAPGDFETDGADEAPAADEEMAVENENENEDEPVPVTEAAAPAEENSPAPAPAMAPPSPVEKPESTMRPSVGAATQEAAAVLGSGELGSTPAPEEEGEEETEAAVVEGSDAETKGSDGEDMEESIEDAEDAEDDEEDKPVEESIEEPEAAEEAAEESAEEAAEEPGYVTVAKVTGEEEKENSAPVDASIGKEMPLTELQPEDAAAVPLSFLED